MNSASYTLMVNATNHCAILNAMAQSRGNKHRIRCDWVDGRIQFSMSGAVAHDVRLYNGFNPEPSDHTDVTLGTDDLYTARLHEVLNRISLFFMYNAL
jgi:hypothetical protein